MDRFNDDPHGSRHILLLNEALFYSNGIIKRQSSLDEGSTYSIRKSLKFWQVLLTTIFKDHFLYKKS